MKNKIQIAIFLTPLFTFAQAETDMESFVNTLSIQNTVVEANAIRTFDNRYKGVAGHPYLFDELRHLVVTNNKGSAFSVYGNYNLQENVLVLLTKTNTLKKIPTENIKTFSYTHSGVTSSFIKKAGSFVENYFEGTNFSLLRGYSKEISKADFKGAYSSGKNQDSFKTEITYHISTDTINKEIKLNIRSLAEVLRKDEGTLKTLAKTNGLKIKRSEDILPFLKLIDESV